MSVEERPGADDFGPKVLLPAKTPSRTAFAPQPATRDEEDFFTPLRPVARNEHEVPEPKRPVAREEKEPPVPFPPADRGDQKPLAQPTAPKPVEQGPVSVPQAASQSDASEFRRTAPARSAITSHPQPIVRPGQPSGFQRAVGALRMVLPVVQKVLPLLDGNVASVVSNLLVTRPPAPPVNLVPFENALDRMHTEHLELRGRIEGQNDSLKKVADQLEMVKEATDRNTLEQREMMDDLRGMRRKVVIFAWVAMGLLAVSIAANVFLFLKIEGVLR